MKKHVVIVGAGFAGLELATRLSESLRDAVRVTLIDRNDSFYFGFSKLDVLLGRQAPTDVLLHYRDIASEGVEFRQATVTAIDPLKRRVITDEGSYDADFLAVALGADYDLAATPGFQQGGFEYYSLAGAERLRDALADFTRGRVLISVLGHPHVPAGPVRGSVPDRGSADEAGSEGRRGHSNDLPDGGARSRHQGGLENIPVSARRARNPVRAQGAGGGSGPSCADGPVGERRERALRPVHRDPRSSRTRSGHAIRGFAPDGWVPVDQTNLATRFAGVYALGDVASGARTVAKAGIFAEAAARVVAADIAARLRDREPPPPYQGDGPCYIEFGDGLVGKAEINFLAGPAPAARVIAASRELAAEKEAFAATRRQSWFGLDTHQVPAAMTTARERG